MDSVRIRALLETENDEVQQLLSVGDAVALGLFRCPIEHPRFEAGRVQLDHIVFPHGQIKLYREAGLEISTPARANVYHANEHYSREPISREGDEVDWIAISREYLEDIVENVAPQLLDQSGGERLFPSASLPISDGLLLAARVLFARLERGEFIDPFALDAYVGELVERLFVEARIGVEAQTKPLKASVQARHRRAVAAACEFIAAHFLESLSLGDIARAASLSRSALCAAFHRETGFSVGDYVERLRLQTAMKWIEKGEVPFSDIATSLGYSSHSHFSARFRLHFKTSPRIYRELRQAPVPHLHSFG